ncbi:uncharacterized protein AB675_8747 [Cyphellophora attinorum]|uniref:Only prolin and serin are matching in the corresponding protein n=1 Tax=Cyphellophora attinorum TaxID=1664694 RepID=A0A0N1HWT4_9EURO|nr:uncharacterized protein AB675_8747 [Phialophora attinorum]KPI44785.1 hypothetical protein AB675_8747 [Phialophora attinorum]
MANIAPPRQSLDENVALSSPVTSVFSRGHASKSSASSLSYTSSPNTRESLDLHGSKLDRVTEEQERDGQPQIATYGCDATSEPQLPRELSSRPADHVLADEYDPYGLYFSDASDNAFPALDPDDYTLGDSSNPGPTIIEQRHFKRQRSADNPGLSLHKRLSSRLGSMSRRLKNRSFTGPRLSIITNASTPASRSGSIGTGPVLSPAMSAISQHESYLPSPQPDSMDESIYGAFGEDEEMTTTEANMAPATTPLLPPVSTEVSREESIQSPLQSPSIAPTPATINSRTSLDINALPSPPLSTRPSVISMRQRSRANTATAPIAEIPPLQLEPYLPSVFNVESYTEFRSNWDHARRNYAKHLARTNEHYGVTSRVYKVTEEKWATIDESWKKFHQAILPTVEPHLKMVKRASEQGSSDEFTQATLPLEKPISHIVMPEIDDKCGKFPEIGDGDIVGPMEVGPPRSAAKSPTLSPTSPKKRPFLRYIQDAFFRA